MPEPITPPEQHSPTTTQTNVLCEPVHYLEDEGRERLEEGIALCLSGGGYRAMLFHVGVLWRLNEIGLLPKLNRISSVSGGSITAAVLALKWQKALRFENGVATNFIAEVVDPIMRLADRTIDVPSVFGGSLWFGTIGEKITRAYRKHLFGDASLQDIVDEKPGVSPRFVFNATNVQSGVLWRFMKPYMRDYLVGEVKNPNVPLAKVVAASAAFPPVLSPVTLKLNPKDFTPNSGKIKSDDFRRRVILTDGGVYDNLGLETAWKRYKTIFVSDAGGGFETKANPSSDWLRHAIRVLFTIDNQVRSLRKRQIVGAYFDQIRRGAYWSISEDLDAFAAENPLQCPFKSTYELAQVSTRLCKLDRTTQHKLINWGYAASSWRYGQFYDKSLPLASKFPFPEVGV